MQHQVGLTNLQTWIDESDTTALVEGNSISVLSESSVETLEGDHKLEGLKGVSLLTDSSYNSTVLMESLTQYSFKEIMPDVYLTYDRDFDQGKTVLLRDCLLATGSVFTVADWGILGEVTAQRNIEFRWVELEDDWAFIQRWWLTEPSTGTKLDSSAIDNQYYIGINYTQGSGTQRIHASWINMTLSTGDATDSASTSTSYSRLEK